MTLQIALLNKSFPTIFALIRSVVIVNVQVIGQVAHLGELGAAPLILAQHQLVQPVARWIDLPNFVISIVVGQLQNFETLVLLGVEGKKIFIHV